MHQRTDLAAGPINGSDRLHIELIQPTDTPPIVVVTWPAKPTVCTPAGYPAAAAASTSHRRIRYRPRTLEGRPVTDQP